MSLETIELLYVLDTNALIWYLMDDSRLGASAGHVFEAAERGETRIAISSIVMAELYYANKKWGYFEHFISTYALILSKPYFRYADFRLRDILEFDQDAAISEMHDRIIVGLARRLEAPLITIDQQITSAGVVEVVW
jgi:PIN domain nuclease of toxin-antitoxin system